MATNTRVDIYWHQTTEKGQPRSAVCTKVGTDSKAYVESDLGPFVMFLDRRAIPAFEDTLAALRAMPEDKPAVTLEPVGAGKE
jgi:hypothetical protein